jgi:hypothetical protein
MGDRGQERGDATDEVVASAVGTPSGLVSQHRWAAHLRDGQADALAVPVISPPAAFLGKSRMD